MIQRYDLHLPEEYDYGSLMEQDEDGDYVLYDDYAILEVENKRLKDQIKQAQDMFPFLRTKEE